MRDQRDHFLLFAILLMIVLAMTRFLVGVMPQNFSAVYALAFCAGVYFRGSLAWWIPLVTLAVTDIVLNVFMYQVPVWHPSLIGNYLAYVILIALGRTLGPRAKLWALMGGGILGALVFYFVTNAVSWLWNPVYAKTLAGLFQALTTGQPGFPHTWEFFRNTLMSGGLFVGLFAGAMKLGEAREPVTEDDEEAEESPELEPEESQG